MIKLVLAVLFFLYLIIPASSVSNIEVQVQLLPFAPTTTLHLGMLILLFSALGVGATVVIGLGEWMSMRVENTGLRRENGELKDEIASLRNVMVMEREAE